MSKLLNIAPIALTATAGTNLLNCAISSLSGPVGITLTQPYMRITKVAYINTTNAAVSVSLFKGSSAAHAAGTEILASGLSIPPNSTVNDFGDLRLDSTDFLTGSGLGVTLKLDGEIDFS
jgi:hypothetical protein